MTEVLNVSPRGLHELLSDAARTAGTDFTLPMLNGILLQVEGEGSEAKLVATSTNRFVLGQAHMPASGLMPTTFLALDRVKQLLRILKPYEKSAGMQCEIRRGAGDFTVAIAGDLVLPAVSVTVPIADVKTDFPKVNHLLPKAEDAKPGGQVAFNPRYLSTFCAIAKGRATELRMVPGAPEKPQLLLIGDAYRALIMPVRTQEKVVDEWYSPDSGREKAPAKPSASAA